MCLGHGNNNGTSILKSRPAVEGIASNFSKWQRQLDPSLSPGLLAVKKGGWNQTLMKKNK